MAKNTNRSKTRNFGGKARLDPDSISLLRLVESERYQDIEAAARRMLETRPRHSLAMKALGFALIGLQRYEEALPIVEFAIELNPIDPELHNNLGIVLSMLMRWDESLAAFDESLRLQANDPETLRNLGVAYFRMHRWNDAVPPLLKAIEVYPGDYVEAVATLADTLFNANRIDEAWTCYNELWKNNDDAIGALSQLLSVSLKRCEWSEFNEQLSILRERSEQFSVLAGNPFSPLAFPGISNLELRKISENFLKTQIPQQFLEENRSEFAHLQNQEIERLRVGYFSADFRNHPVGQVISEVIERHNRSRVEVFGYSLGIDDKSPLRARLIQGFDHFSDLAGASVVETTKRIRADGIHVLIDLHGWTSDGRPESLALRCAPVQVNWLGYAGTIGHARLADYLIGDAVVTPMEHRDFYAETIAHLPWCYLPVDTMTLPGPPPTRAEAGLPESGFIYCSFNNSYKFNPVVFDLWGRILAESDGSYLWLSDPGGQAKDRLRSQMSARGVDPSRIIFAARVDGRVEHLARLQLADLALDPFPYNSHSSGGDVLLAGVPMVALLGETFPGRVGASLLRAARLDDLVATTPQAYFEIAVELFRNPARLREYRECLSGRNALPLFDMQGFTKSLEDLYLRFWNDWRTGVSHPISVA